MAETIMKVETSSLKNSANILDQKKQEYKVQWQRIYTEISSLIVEWQGQSSDAFNKKIEEYRPTFEELEKIIESYTQFLKTTAESMEKLEESLAAESSKL